MADWSTRDPAPARLAHGPGPISGAGLQQTERAATQRGRIGRCLIRPRFRFGTPVPCASIDVLVRADVLQQLLLTLVMPHQVKPLVVRLPLCVRLGLAEEAVERLPVPLPAIPSDLPELLRILRSEFLY